MAGRTHEATPALPVVAAALGIVFAGAMLPTPLYPLYRDAFGFSGVILTLIYAVYVLGNLVALLVFGRLSDQAGRRVVVVWAIGIGIASTVVFVVASGTGWLFGARILSGVSTGLAAGAATAWITELQPHGDKARAAVIATAANLAGLAVGALMSGLLAQFAPWKLRLAYIVYLLVLFGIGAAILRMPETVGNPIGRMHEVSLQPRLGVPRGIRARFLPPAVTAFAIFALFGFYGALIPDLLAKSLHLASPVIAGVVVFELFLVAAATAVVAHGANSRVAMFSGLALLPPCLALLVLAQAFGAMPILLVATALAGLSGALGYRGSLEVVNRIAPADMRSEVVSSYLVTVYLDNALPVIGIGMLSAVAGSMVAHIVFAAVITLLAAAALAAGVRYAPDQ